MSLKFVITFHTARMVVLALTGEISSSPCLWHFPGEIWNCGQGADDQVLLDPGNFSGSWSKSLQCYVMCMRSSNVPHRMMKGIMIDKYFGL